MPLAVAAAVASVTGCGSSSGAGKPAAGNGSAVTVTLTDAGCSPDKRSVPAGPVTFTITNSGADAVTEAELLSGGRIIGEKENITPGLSGTFSLNLAAGSYTLTCPGGHGSDRVEFTVTPASSSSAADPQLSSAVSNYQRYVTGEATQLVTSTDAFVAAVQAGDLARAQQLYAPARVHYERIEPVAESFGDLDKAIDARAADAPDPSTWSGFHRLEKALWADHSLAGTAPIATKLAGDVRALQTRITDTQYQPAQIANGATELLNEIARTKVTGEEERYSHLDLVDFQANLDGARTAIDALRPALATHDAQLADTISRRFAAVDSALAAYRTGSGPTDFRTYDAVPQDAQRNLAQLIDALAEPVSQVAGVVVQG